MQQAPACVCEDFEQVHNACSQHLTFNLTPFTRIVVARLILMYMTCHAMMVHGVPAEHEQAHVQLCGASNAFHQILVAEILRSGPRLALIKIAAVVLLPGDCKPGLSTGARFLGRPHLHTLFKAHVESHSEF